MSRAEITRRRRERTVKATSRRRPARVFPSARYRGSLPEWARSSESSRGCSPKSSSHSLERTPCRAQLFSELPSSHSNWRTSGIGDSPPRTTGVYSHNIQNGPLRRHATTRWRCLHGLDVRLARCGSPSQSGGRMRSTRRRRELGSLRRDRTRAAQLRLRALPLRRRPGEAHPRRARHPAHGARASPPGHLPVAPRRVAGGGVDGERTLAEGGGADWRARSAGARARRGARRGG